MLFSKKVTLILISVATAGLALLFTVNYTDACRLNEVRLNQAPLENWQEELGLNASRSVVRQPMDRLAEFLIGDKNVFKVDVAYTLTGRLDIRTNNFRPVCFLVDAGSGKMFGLTDEARVVSLKNSEFGWEHPILTSVQAGSVYDHCSDARVAVVVEQLERLRWDNVDLYRLIDEIDFGVETFVQVALSGLPYRLKIRAENFHAEVTEFVQFVSRFAPDLEGVTSIDLRFDDMIICAGGKS